MDDEVVKAKLVLTQGWDIIITPRQWRSTGREVDISRVMLLRHVRLGQHLLVSGNGAPPGFIAVHGTRKEDGPSLFAQTAKSQLGLFVFAEAVQLDSRRQRSVQDDVGILVGAVVPEAPEAIVVAHVFFEGVDGVEELQVCEAGVYFGDAGWRVG